MNMKTYVMNFDSFVNENYNLNEEYEDTTISKKQKNLDNQVDNVYKKITSIIKQKEQLIKTYDQKWNHNKKKQYDEKYDKLDSNIEHFENILLGLQNKYVDASNEMNILAQICLDIIDNHNQYVTKNTFTNKNNPKVKEYYDKWQETLKEYDDYKKNVKIQESLDSYDELYEYQAVLRSGNQGAVDNHIKEWQEDLAKEKEKLEALKSSGKSESMIKKQQRLIIDYEMNILDAKVRKQEIIIENKKGKTGSSESIKRANNNIKNLVKKLKEKSKEIENLKNKKREKQ